jgi:heme-degrading monooxygenase HmoA
MYTVVRRYSGNTELADALVQNQGEVKRIISEVNGFRAYYLVRNEDGNTFTISVFEDKAGAEESSRAAAEWLRENLADLQLSPPEILGGETLVSF